MRIVADPALGKCFYNGTIWILNPFHQAGPKNFAAVGDRRTHHRHLDGGHIDLTLSDADVRGVTKARQPDEICVSWSENFRRRFLMYGTMSGPFT